ncbi:hypothetical protein ACS0TY_018960 [Phlomoides rotata]
MFSSPCMFSKIVDTSFINYHSILVVFYFIPSLFQLKTSDTPPHPFIPSVANCEESRGAKKFRSHSGRLGEQLIEQEKGTANLHQFWAEIEELVSGFL